jgi:hypothetical protein
MNSTDADSEPEVDDLPRPPAKFQFSLLEFLTAVTLISIVLGPVMRIRRIGELAEILVFMTVICGFVWTAHFFANWILTPRGRRPAMLAAGWFWGFAGCMLLLCGLHELAYMFDFQDTDVREPRLLLWLFNRLFLFAGGVCFAAALVIGQHNRRSTA